MGSEMCIRDSVWGELMRAYTLTERGQASGLQERRLPLGGFVPERGEP